MRPRQRVSSIRLPANPTSAGSSVSDAATVIRDHRGGADGQAGHGDAHEQHAEQRDDDGGAGEQDRPAGGVERDADRLADRVAGVELLAVAGDDQQCVVDADTQADHDAEERGEVGDREDVAEQRDDGATEADAEQRAIGRPMASTEPRHDDQDDDREADAERLRRRSSNSAKMNPPSSTRTPSISSTSSRISLRISSAAGTRCRPGTRRWRRRSPLGGRPRRRSNARRPPRRGSRP